KTKRLLFMEKVTIRVPASTSNLGPGFDCLGIALRIYNSVTVNHAKDRRRQEKIVARAADLFFKRAKRRRFAFSCSAKETVPRCRGLGSSATIRLGVLHGLNELIGRPLDRLSIFRLCAELEGHPDNAAPSSFGGFTVARGENVQRFDISRLKFVLLIPDFEIRTSSARKILPAKIAVAAAAENIGNASVITAAFAARHRRRRKSRRPGRISQRQRIDNLRSRAAQSAKSRSRNAAHCKIDSNQDYCHH